MKYIEGMTMCTKDHNENLNEIDTPAEITITCKYEYDGFCLCEETCDFFDVLKQNDADMLNPKKK